MIRPESDTLEFILQVDVISDLLPNIGKEQWQVLSLRDDDPPHRFGMGCAFLDEGAAARAMERDSWDMSTRDGKPGFSMGWADGKKITAYHRFGRDDGVRPLVLYRSFYGAFPEYVEIDEEFRLYHDLAEDKTRGLLLAFDTSGREIEVVRVTPDEVRARLKYVRQFQAGMGLYLAIYVDSVRFSQMPLADIPADEHQRLETDGVARWRRSIVACNFEKEFEIFSRLLCKVILDPPARDRAGIWPFEDDDQRTVDFIIGIDEDGNEVEHTSDPDQLGDYFGGNAGAPHYVTPVYFRREVLAKYFAEPERYEVLDGRLVCLNLWSCQIDNNLESYVAVFLGDLGRDLPYEERLHWRQFNVPPGEGMSETTIRRSFLAQWANAQAPDLMFRREYAKITREWERAQGWPLFLALSPGDAHLLNTVRIPVTTSQAEFDEQIGYLARLLVDSLNEEELARRADTLEEGSKGIMKLAGFLEAAKFPERQSLIQLLRDLQTLRSTGSAHRKGSAYGKIIAKLGVDPVRKPDAVRRLLGEATAALRALRLHYCEDRESDD